MSITNLTLTPDDGIFRFYFIEACDGVIIDRETVVSNAGGVLRATTPSGLVVTSSQVKFGTNCHTQPIDYGGNSNVTTAAVRIQKDSSVLFDALSARRNIHITELSDSSIIENGTGRNLFVYSQLGGVLQDCVIRGVNVLEIVGKPSISANLTIDDANYGYLNWAAGRLDFLGFAVSNIAIAHVWLGAGSGSNVSYHWNNHSSFDNTQIYFQFGGTYYEGYTASLQFIDRDTGVGVQGVKVKYDSTLSGSRANLGEYLTDTNGDMVGVYDSQNQVDGSSQVRPTLFVITAVSNPSGNSHPLAPLSGGVTYDIDTITPYLELKSYLYENPSGFSRNDAFVISSAIGSLNPDYSVGESNRFLMALDVEISESVKATVDAYTEINSTEELYDSAKSFYYDNPLDDANLLVLNSRGDLGSNNLTIDSTATTAFAYSGNTMTVKASAFAGNLKTLGIVSLANLADINGLSVDGVLNFEVAGAYTINNGAINSVTNSSAGNVIINATGSTVITNNLDPSTITIQAAVNVSVENCIIGKPVYVAIIATGEVVIDEIAASATASTTRNYSGDEPVLIRHRDSSVSGTQKKRYTNTDVIRSTGMTHTINFTKDTLAN